jgi:transcriptional regulator with XRE-family HTH domain
VVVCGGFNCGLVNGYFIISALFLDKIRSLSHIQSIMRNTGWVNQKHGQRMVGAILLRQRPHTNGGRGKTLRECCKEIGIESYNLLSYIERGITGITPERVGPIARAYELDPDDFQLVWLIGKSIDAGISPEKLSLIFDRPDLWDRASGSADGGGSTVSPTAEVGVRHEVEFGNRPGGTASSGRIDLRAYLRQLRREWRSPAPDETPETNGTPGGGWWQSVVD